MEISEINLDGITDMDFSSGIGTLGASSPMQMDNNIHMSRQPMNNRVVPLDDLQMLANENKISTLSNDLRQLPQQPSSMGRVETTVLSDIVPVQQKSYDRIFNVSDINVSTSAPQENFQPTNNGGIGMSAVPSDASVFNANNNASGDEYSQQPAKSPEEIQREKQDLLFKLERLAQRGCPMTRQYTMNSNIEDIRNEFLRIKAQNDLKNSVKFQRRMLMACVTGIEFLNSKFNPIDAHLDGWSESVHESINEYDDIFEELHDKYKERAKVAPEIKLLMSLGGSAIMFHLTQSFIKSSLPSMTDMFTQNPDFMRQFGNTMAGAVGQNNPGLGNFMNDMFTARGQPDSPPETPPRREMKGPSGIDELLGRMGQQQSSSPIKSQPRVESVSNASLKDLEMYGDRMKNIEVSSDKKKKKSTNGMHLSL